MRAVGFAQSSCLVFSLSFVLAAPRTSMRCLSLSELAKAFTEMSDMGTETGLQKAKSVEGMQHRIIATAGGASLQNDAALPNTTNVAGITGGMRTFGGRKGVGSVVSFSTVYSQKLGEMPFLQFALELERECKQQHYSHMWQCLVEVWRRLSILPPTEIVISDKEACGELKNDAHTSFFLRTDDILECVLRILAKTNIDGVQQDAGFAAELRGYGVHPDWVTQLSTLLMQWLTARAASMNASRSARLLHFLGQQKAFCCDAVLETLRDNIELCLANYHHHASQESITTYSVNNSFELGDFAVLLDAIARVQMDFVRLLSNEKTTGPGEPPDALCIKDLINSCQNPIFNFFFYNVVVSGLLRAVRDGSLHLTRNGSPSTFFFLILALAKIRWFHSDSAEVLLPQLHEALRVFPGQFLAVLLLLGRREVKVCRCETTELLLQTLLDAMQKRGQRYTAVDGHRRDRSGSAELAAGAASSNPGMLTTSNVHCSGNLPAAPLSLVDLDGDGNNDSELFFLFSSDPSNCVSCPSDTGGSPQSSAAAFTTSFIDIRSVPVFFDSLNHVMMVTLEYCSAHGMEAERRALSAKAETLYETLLNDTQSGIVSLHALLGRPGLVEKMLLSVLRMPSNAVHPFVVELAYVFTRHVASRTCGKNKKVDGGNAAAVALHWQARVAEIVGHLVSRGVLTPDTFVIRDEVIRLAPRVAAEVEAEKKRLLERYMMRQERKHGREAKKKNTVSTAAVFAGFSRTVLSMTQ